MSVVQIVEQMKDAITIDSNGARIPFKYLIRVSNDTTRPIDLVGATDGSTTLPVYGQLYSIGSHLKVTTIEIEHDESSPRMFYCGGEYSVPPPGQGEAKPADKNTWAQQIRGSGVEYIDRVNTDVNGLRMKNAYGDVFAAETEVEKFDEIVTVTFYADDPNDFITETNACRGLINDDTVTMTIGDVTRSFEAGSLKCGNATWQSGTAPGGEPAWVCELPLIYRKQFAWDDDDETTNLGWQAGLLNQGIHYKDSSGKTITAPDQVTLRGDGTRVPLGSSEVGIVLYFDVIRQVDFDALLATVTA